MPDSVSGQDKTRITPVPASQADEVESYMIGRVLPIGAVAWQLNVSDRQPFESHTKSGDPLPRGTRSPMDLQEGMRVSLLSSRLLPSLFRRSGAKCRPQIDLAPAGIDPSAHKGCTPHIRLSLVDAGCFKLCCLNWAALQPQVAPVSAKHTVIVQHFEREQRPANTPVRRALTDWLLPVWPVLDPSWGDVRLPQARR